MFKKEIFWVKTTLFIFWTNNIMNRGWWDFKIRILNSVKSHIFCYNHFLAFWIVKKHSFLHHRYIHKSIITLHFWESHAISSHAFFSSFDKHQQYFPLQKKQKKCKIKPLSMRACSGMLLFVYENEIWMNGVSKAKFIRTNRIYIF